MSCKQRIIIYIYRIANRRIRRFIEYALKKTEGDEFWSLTLRAIYSEIYDVKIGIGSYGCFNLSNFPSGTKIGNYCSIAGGVRYFNANHPKNFVSTHPLFYNPALGFVETEKIKRESISIGNDVWIGWNSLIMPSCKNIGNGAIIGAGSVVTKDVDPYSIVAGNPAKVIGFRHSDINKEDLNLLSLEEIGPEEIRSNIEKFDDPQEFIKFMKKV